MLNFDPARFLTIESNAIALAEPIRRAVQQTLSEGISNVFFLGAGGAGVLMQPAMQLIARESAFPVQLLHAAEILVATPTALGPQSLVVIPSLSGTTEEALRVEEFAKAKGATVLALTGHADTPVAKGASVNFTTFAEDDTSSESFYLQSLFIALAIIDAVNGTIEFDRIVPALSGLPAALLFAKEQFEPRAKELAEAFRDEPYHIVTGAGPSWTEAWYYATCILEEMQWIRTRPVHAADFFHGTLELVEPGVSVIALKGEDETRSLVERVEAFTPTVTDKFTVIDSADFTLPGISTDVRAHLSHVVHATVLERLSAHLEVLRDHPLTTRRYYRRMVY